MKTLLDVGCNDLAGFKLLCKIESISPEVQKIFVEANPECWDDLDRDLANVPNSFLIKKGVSMHGQDTTLITREDENKCTGSTIMGEQFFKDSLGRWGIQAIPKYYTIQTITLEDIISQFNIDTKQCILKLDAEGIEYDVLSMIIDKNIAFKKIYCEFHVHNLNDQSRKNEIIKKLKTMTEVIEWH